MAAGHGEGIRQVLPVLAQVCADGDIYRKDTEGDWTVDIGKGSLWSSIDLFFLRPCGQVHHFPSGVASRTASFLNDIVLDITDPARKFAYISDSDEAAIVVYDHSRDKSWKVQHAAMRANPRVDRNVIKAPKHHHPPLLLPLIASSLLLSQSTSFDFLNPPDHQTIADNNVNGIAFSPQVIGPPVVRF